MTPEQEQEMKEAQREILSRRVHDELLSLQASLCVQERLGLYQSQRAEDRCEYCDLFDDNVSKALYTGKCNIYRYCE